MPRWLSKVLTRIREHAAARRVLLAGTILYVKLLVRTDCVVVSFHEDEGGHEEEDA